MPALMQAFAGLRSQYGATARRNNRQGLLRQLIQNCLFKVPESLLTISLEGNPDGAPQAFFDDVIRVKKGKLQTPGELPPDGGFTCAGEAD